MKKKVGKRGKGLLERETIRDLAERMLKQGIGKLKRKGWIRPRAFILADNERVYIKPLEFSDNPVDRLAVAHQLREIASTVRAKAILFISDVFFTNNLYGPRPSQAPDRREAIFVYGEDTKGNFAIMQEYEWTLKNKIKLRQKRVSEDDDTIGGMFTGLLQASTT